MSFTKGKLRLARDALDKKDYAKAKEAASEVLDYEISNYHAHVFLGLASLELGEYNESEQAYLKAIEIQQSQPLAWQGLSRLYERTERWSAYVKSLYKLMDIQYSQNEAVKCGESMQRIIDVCRRHCDRLELVDALCHLLPNSRFYSLLSTLPEPDNSSPSGTTTLFVQRAVYESLPVLEEIVSLIESHENDVIKREIQKRRTRLGAPNLEQLQKLVGQEVWSSSRLPEIYTEIMNHPGASDNLRRDAESKLLRYKYRYLCSLPSDNTSVEAKERVLGDVNELVRSAILLKIPDELAWNLSLEHQDSESLAMCDRQLIRDFVKLFPNLPVAKLLNHFFLYMGWRLLDVDDFEELGTEECYNAILDVHSKASNHILANRALAEVYLKELDYENAIKVADNTLILLKQREGDTGVRFPRASMGMKAIKATGLVHLYPPRHHGLASTIIEDVLSSSPDNTSCLLGRAFILETSEQWEEANTHFSRVASLRSEDEFDRLRSIEEAAWCRFQGGQHEEGLSSLRQALALLNGLPGRESDRARCLWRIGQCQWAHGSNRQESYRCFIASLKQDPTYAPAYTSLGIYYVENVPPDPVRASKCFQKAFELDSREAEAARRLAQGFAEDHEWDLVEVVARRTVEGEGGLSGGLQLQSSDHPSRPTNSWAWKAIGTVELTYGKHVEAVKAFQTSLITNVNDGSLWLRLGEAYSKAGRHAAALKAFHKAKELNPDDWLCSYFISGVKRQMGEFQEAIAICMDILSKHPDEPVVQLSLIQSHFDLGRLEQSEGFQERAEQSFLMAISLALKIVHSDTGARMVIGWKLLADALFYLSRQGKYNNDTAIRDALREVVDEFTLSREDDLTTVVPKPNIIGESPVSWKQVLAGAMMVYRYRLSMASPGIVCTSHWYDLGVGLQAWASKTGNTSEEVNTKITSYLRQALQENPRDASTWAALGTFYFPNHGKLAQHAYVTALEIDSKNVVNWNNLGFLYLYHSDYELASESFTRAQTLDPDNAVSWIGQALLRSTTGLESEAQELLAYAITLNPTKPEAGLRFAHGTFQKHSRSLDPPSHHLISAFFALHSYCSRSPGDAFGYHLFGLVNESLEKLELAERLVEKSTSLLEAEYEDTEDPIIERQFALANSNLARLRLARQDLTGATDSFQNVLGLLAGGDDALTVKLRIHAHLGFGLAKFLSAEIDSALESFQLALDCARSDLLMRSHAVTLLSQAMWTIGSEDFRETAKSQLLQCITDDPVNLTAIKTLTAMGILSDDENLVDAALSELLDMPAEQRQELDPSNDVDYLLVHYNLGKGDLKKALLFAQRALHIMPSNMKYRIGLATMMIQYGAPQKVLGLLSGYYDDPQDPQLLSERLCLLAIAYTLGDSADGIRRGLRCAQKAVMVLPCSIRSWQTLGFVRSQAAACLQSISMQV